MKKKVIEMIEGYAYVYHEEKADGEYLLVLLRRMKPDEEGIE
tara:strand:- start:203 stop:328 length:126 start_codon:yes stop_codon:yes gene_type:complete